MGITTLDPPPLLKILIVVNGPSLLNVTFAIDKRPNYYKKVRTDFVLFTNVTESMWRFDLYQYTGIQAVPQVPTK